MPKKKGYSLKKQSQLRLDPQKTEEFEKGFRESFGLTKKRPKKKKRASR